MDFRWSVHAHALYYEHSLTHLRQDLKSWSDMVPHWCIGCLALHSNMPHTHSPLTKAQDAAQDPNTNPRSNEKKNQIIHCASARAMSGHNLSLDRGNAGWRYLYSWHCWNTECMAGTAGAPNIYAYIYSWHCWRYMSINVYTCIHGTVEAPNVCLALLDHRIYTHIYSWHCWSTEMYAWHCLSTEYEQISIYMALLDLPTYIWHVSTFQYASLCTYASYSTEFCKFNNSIYEKLKSMNNHQD